MSVCKGMLRHLKKAEHVIHKLQDAPEEFVSELDASLLLPDTSIDKHVSFADLIDMKPHDTSQTHELLVDFADSVTTPKQNCDFKELFVPSKLDQFRQKLPHLDLSLIEH